MKVDVIIPTLNSLPVLRDCLRAIKEYIPYNRIIVIDGGSSDGSIEVSKRYGCEVYTCKKSLGESRMLGVSKASTEWILFIDSDIVVDKNFFKSMIKYIDDRVGAIQGLALPPEKYYSFQNKQEKPREIGVGERGFTNCTLLRTELLKDINLKGINAYEDWLIKNDILRKGYKWLVVPVPVKHYHDYKGYLDPRLKARWNGAGLRKTGVTNVIYLIKWFLGIAIKNPIQSNEKSLIIYLHDLDYFFNTLIGYIFYKKYDKINRKSEKYE